MDTLYGTNSKTIVGVVVGCNFFLFCLSRRRRRARSSSPPPWSIVYGTHAVIALRRRRRTRIIKRLAHICGVQTARGQGYTRRCKTRPSRRAI